MCGNSICQDRRFLARHMPALERHFHYRNLDVSTLKELARRWMPAVVGGFAKQGSAPGARRHLRIDRRTALLPPAHVRQAGLIARSRRLLDSARHACYIRVVISESNLLVSWRAHPRGLVALMGLYESNYLRLTTLAGHPPSLRGTRDLAGRRRLRAAADGAGSLALHHRPDADVPAAADGARRCRCRWRCPTCCCAPITTRAWSRRCQVREAGNVNCFKAGRGT